MALFEWQSVEDFVSETLGQKWAMERLVPFPIQRLFMDFFTIERRWKGSTNVDLERVKGTVHPDYVGMTWGEFLQKGKRMKHNLSMLEANPGYYLDEGHKEPTMSYLVHDGGYWVYADGNHRTCIGRFYLDLIGTETKLKGVEIWEVELDLEVYEKWWRSGGVRGPLRVESEIINRDDGPGWMSEKFKLRYFIQEKEVNRSEFLGFEGVGDSGWRERIRGFFQRLNRGSG